MKKTNVNIPVRIAAPLRDDIERLRWERYNGRVPFVGASELYHMEHKKLEEEVKKLRERDKQRGGSAKLI